VRQFNQMMVEVRLDGHSRVYSDDCISVDLQRTMMSFFVKSGLYVAQRPVLPTSGAAASATTSHAALRLPRDTPTSEDDGGGTSGAEDGGNDSQLLHSSSGSSTAPNIRLTVSSPRHERRQSAENAWLQSASDAEENAELGLSASLAALELDFERSFSQSLDLSSNGSIGVGGPAGTTTSTTAAATGSSASRTSDHKPAAGAPEKKFLLLEREDAELKRAMQESLATAHAAQLAMLSGNHHQLNSAANMLHFDDDDDDDLDYLSASANVFDAEEDDAESEDEDDDEENDDEDQ
jgi:hypothetical protein